MAFDNKDNKDNKDKDPWTDKNRNQGPPEIDELFRKLNNKLKGAMGGGNSSGTKSSGEGGFGIIFGLIFIALIIVWFLTGIYIVSPGEQGVVLRFGKYERTVDPGIHWLPRIVESVRLVDVKHIYHYSYQSEMLTKDENIVSVKLTVLYRINKPNDFLFNVANPSTSLEQATKSALRQIVGRMNLGPILTTGREEVRTQTESQLKKILSRYNTGIIITDVALQETNPPEQVVEAFDDAVKAREDAQRYVNRAEAYRSVVVPKANGQESRILASAKAFRERIILQAKGDVEPFLAEYSVYKQAPAVTKHRLYYQAMQQTLEDSNKVVMDNKQDKSNFYMPMPQLMQQQKAVEDEHSELSASKEIAKSAIESGEQLTANSELSGPINQRSVRPTYPVRGNF